MADIVLPEVCVNGVPEVGLAAGADAKLGDADRIRLVPKNMIDTASAKVKVAVALMHWHDNAPEALRTVVDAAISLIVIHGWHGVTSTNENRADSDYVCMEEIPAGLASQEVVDRMVSSTAYLRDESNRANAALLAVCTKVNWWQANHHTGQGELAGYVSKAIGKATGVGPMAGDAIVGVVHRLGHCVSTKLVLGKWFRSMEGYEGCTVGQDVADDASIPEPTRDITLRLESLPSGCALAGYVRYTLGRAAATPFGCFFRADDTLPAFLVSCAEAVATPWAFHVGSHFLTGHRGRVIDSVSDELVAECVAYNHIVAPRGTLAMSRAAPKYDDIQDMVVAFVARARALRVKLVESRPDDAAMEVIVASLGGVMGGNSIAAAAPVGRAYVPPVAAMV